jgi:hypothetical protein
MICCNSIEVKAMRIVLRVVGVLLLAMGVIWILQGINILPGSFMTGQIQWAYRGAVAAVAGLILFIVAGRRRGQN